MQFRSGRRDWLIRSLGWAAAGRFAFSTSTPFAAESDDLTAIAEKKQRILAAIAAHTESTGGWGASVALSKGDVRASATTGFCDAEHQRPVQDDTLFRIASVTKPITAAISLTLVRENRLTLDDRAFSLLGLEPDPERGDPRLKDITVGHLLKHQGGWDRAESYDPMFHQPEIRQELQRTAAPGMYDILRYMRRQPLQFTPGEKSAYSNFGYCVLGRLIERVTDMPYGDAVKSIIAAPLGIEADLLLGRQQERQPRESDYSGDQKSFDLDVMDAHGGLIATASAICRFLEAYWITGEPRAEQDRSQEWVFYGSLPGTATMAWQRPDGWNVAVLINGRRDQEYLADLNALKKSVGEAFG